MDKVLGIALLVWMTLVCSLPRSSENPALSGRPTQIHWQAHRSGSNSNAAANPLLHVRKFRRRQTHFLFRADLTRTYLPPPLNRVSGRLTPLPMFFISCASEPLIHPPA